jgi:glycosyltransferase involved in cell wall biosynthesis
MNTSFVPSLKNPIFKISVVICTLNEEKNLPKVLPKIPTWIDEIVLVDGHSTDKTVYVAKILSPNIRVFYQQGHGKGEALRYGISQANADIIVTLDADGATNPSDLTTFITPLLKGYDFAKGSRFSVRAPHNKPVHRIFGNLLIAAIFNILYREKFTDLCSGYNAFWKKKIERLSFGSADCLEDEPLLIAKAEKAGLKLIEVGHIDFGRYYGESKSPSWRQGFKAITSIVRERLRVS